MVEILLRKNSIKGCMEHATQKITNLINEKIS